MYDLIITGGTVLDPLSGVDKVADVGVTGGRITKVGSIKETCKQMVDAQGCYVTPGLIDFHVHCAYGFCTYAIPPYALFSSGVTSAIDGGTTGIATFEGFYRNVVANSQVDVKTFLLLSSSGQISGRVSENMNPALFEEEEIVAFVKRYRHNIIGLKIRMERMIAREYGIEPLTRALAIAERVGLPLSVHASDTPGEVKEVLELLRPGDIYCHVYHQLGNTILDVDGKILPEVWEARKRGVLFEVGHGSTRFSLAVCKAALEQGFAPDLVSSDLTTLSLNAAPTYSLPYIFSELMALGMEFKTLIDLCTRAPASFIDPKRTQFLAAGEPADLAVFRIVDTPYRFVDYKGNEVMGTEMVKAELTVKGGLIMHRQWDFL